MHQRGRYPYSVAQIEAAMENHVRCRYQDINRQLLSYYPTGLEMHDALYVAAVHLLQQAEPDLDVAVVTKDSEIRSFGIKTVW